MAQQAIVLNRVEEELLSMSDVAKTDDIKLQQITENAARSTKNLIDQLEGESSEDLPLGKLLGWTNSSGVLGVCSKWRWQKKFSWKKTLKKKGTSSKKSETIQNMMMAFEKASGSKLPS